MSTQDESIEREFDAVMRMSGIEVPPERRAGTLIAFKEMRRFAALVRRPHSATAEPSNTFSLKPFVRRP
jgi:hypothetical protein